MTPVSYARPRPIHEARGKCVRPQAEGAPCYPIPRPPSAVLYKRYQALAATESRVHFVRRLATYKYYNRDQAVAQALTTCRKLVGAEDSRARGVEASP